MSWEPQLAAGRPKYLAIVEALESDLQSGRLKPGDQLPPQREIADRLGVTIATVTKGIGEAIRRGLVTARAGSGTFVRAATVADSTTDRPSIDLSLNGVPASPAAPFLDKALSGLRAGADRENLFGYQPSIGIERHRSAMAGWITLRGMELRPGDICLTHGAQHGLAACFAGLLRAGDTVLCEAWTYTGIRRVADMARVRLVGVGMEPDGLDPVNLAEKLKSTGAKLVVCMPAVQNPTTATMSAARRREILAVCARFDALVIEDDIYGRLSGDEIRPLAASNRERVIYLTSVSKCISPGFRLGVLVAPERVSAQLRDALLATHWTAPSFFGELFARMVERGLAEQCLAAQQREAGHRLSLMKRIMPQERMPRLATYHLWQALPAPWRAEDFVAALSEEGVRVSPASHFAVDAEAANASYIRICLGGTDDRAALGIGLSAIERLLRSKPRIGAPVI